jgi:hypothetical protein
VTEPHDAPPAEPLDDIAPPEPELEEPQEDALARRVNRLEERLGQGRARAVFTCSHCQSTEDRELPPSSPTSYTELLYALREEIRMAALLDKPIDVRQKPPAFPALERSVVAALLAGLRPAHFQQLERQHFSVLLYGWIWELAQGMTGAIDLRVLAAKFEARGLGRAETVHTELVRLGGPFQPVASGEQHVAAIIDAAWKRRLLFDVSALADAMQGPSPCTENEVRQALLDILGRIDAGPRGDIVQRELDRAAAQPDATDGARERARIYGWQRGLVYRAAGIVGWLRRAPGLETIDGARERLVALLARMDQVRHQIQHLIDEIDRAGGQR